MGHVWLLIKFEVFLKGPKLIGHIIGQSGDNEFRKTKKMINQLDQAEI